MPSLSLWALSEARTRSTPQRSAARLPSPQISQLSRTYRPAPSRSSARPLYMATFRATYRRTTSPLPAAPLSRWQHRHRATVCVLRQGARFDPDLPQTIRLEFAKSNTKVSKPKQQVSAAAPHPALMHPAFSHGRKYLPRAHGDLQGSLRLTETRRGSQGLRTQGNSLRLTVAHRDSQRLTVIYALG